MHTNPISLCAVLFAGVLGCYGCAPDVDIDGASAPDSIAVAPEDHPHDQGSHQAHLAGPQAFQVPDDSCTAQQRSQLASVVRSARGSVDQALQRWNRSENRDVRGARWFGSSLTLDQRLRIQAMLIGIQDGMANAHYGFRCRTSCDDIPVMPGYTVVAYVYSSFTDPWVYLCPFYWTLPATGLNSQASTIVHEAAHLQGAADVIYGTDGSMNLAATNPESALKNADNYGFYASDPGGPINTTPMPPVILIR